MRHRSDPLQQLVEIERGSLAKAVHVSPQKIVGSPATLLAEHGQEIPVRVNKRAWLVIAGTWVLIGNRSGKFR